MKTNNLAKKRTVNKLANNKGSAMIEAIPMVIIMAVLIKVCFGFWGVIQTGIINSIAGYNHTLATFAFRPNLTYLRPGFHEGRNGDKDIKNYAKAQARFHSVNTDRPRTAAQQDSRIATARSFGLDKRTEQLMSGAADEISTSSGRQNSRELFEDIDENKGSAQHTRWTQLVWIKTSYGICLTVKCKEN